MYDLVLVGMLDLPDGGQATVASVHTPAEPLANWIRDYGLRDYPALSFPLEEEELVTLRRPGSRQRPYYNDFAFVALERLVRGGRFVVAGDWNTSRGFPGGPEFFQRADERGWAECHSGPEEQSYFKKGCGPYQLDHGFCDAETAGALKTCYVRANDLPKSLSDHVPLIMEFEWVW